MTGAEVVLHLVRGPEPASCYLLAINANALL